MRIYGMAIALYNFRIERERQIVLLLRSVE